MCEKHGKEVNKYQFKSEAESLKVLRNAHSSYTHDCCPSIPGFADRVAALEEIVGVYPVVSNRKSELIAEIRDLTYCYKMRDKIGYELRQLFSTSYGGVSDEDWEKNRVPADRFKAIKEAIEDFSSDEEFRRFTLIKKSSPKLSNIIASLLKFNDRDPEKDDLVKNFNDRGNAVLKEYELVISIEPHKIAGMSAFGKFSSCQDWIEKTSLSHDYHSYAHQAWANLLDETCGIAFIRKVGSDTQTVDNHDVQDMLSRSLVRVLPLEDGRAVVYFHRIYSRSPYHIYMESSLKHLTLPDNYHKLLIFGDESYSGENKHGKKFKSYETIKYHQTSLSCDCGKREVCDNCDGEGTREYDCNNCDGSGYVSEEEEVDCWRCEGSGRDEDDEECYNCDGSGQVWEDKRCECDECDGSGTVESDCTQCDGRGGWDSDETVYPYNDHSDWFDLERCDDYITFRVPQYILKWDEEPTPVTELTHNGFKIVPFTERLAVGTKVKIIDNLEKGCRYANLDGYQGVGLAHQMIKHAGQIATITRSENGEYLIDLDDSEWNWREEMFEGVAIPKEIVRNLKVGDKVRVRADLGDESSHYEMYGNPDISNCANGSMQSWAGKVVTISSVNTQYHLEESGFSWVDEMFSEIVQRADQPLSQLNNEEEIA